MQRSKTTGALIILGVALVLVCAMALIGAQPAEAQCGSQASSCKNCHETQGQDPVNADGTGWHESHAFGDFCYVCHAGNNQAMEAEAAHDGMVAPMSDVRAACAQCHPGDLQARADVYTAALGIAAVQAAAPAAAPAAPTEAPAAVELAPAAPAVPMVANDPNLVDYVQRYNEQVLGQHRTNWGNVILIVMLVGLLGAGAFLINRRERWLSLSITEKKGLDKEYPLEIVDIADRASRLRGPARRDLRDLLEQPGAEKAIKTALDGLSADASSGEEQQ